MSMGRSFIKGPRFAFKKKDSLMCCEQCVFGTGKHTCSLPPAKRSRKPSEPLVVPNIRSVPHSFWKRF
jgi:hypothetical protein